MEPTGPRVIAEQCYCAPTPATRLAPELRCLAWVDLPRGARAVPAAVLRLHLWSPLLPPFSSHAPPRWSPAGDESPTSMSHVHSVPWVQFQVLLTRLSAFFSTFVRTTSPLSVFVSYLDLGEIYLLLCAALTSNTTLRDGEIWMDIVPRAQGALTLSGAAFLPTLPHGCHLLPRPQKEHRQRLITVPPPFSFDLFPLRSPLLWESLLFSFPPLNNMLKFSG